MKNTTDFVFEELAKRLLYRLNLVKLQAKKLKPRIHEIKYACKTYTSNVFITKVDICSSIFVWNDIKEEWLHFNALPPAHQLILIKRLVSIQKAKEKAKEKAKVAKPDVAKIVEQLTVKCVKRIRKSDNQRLEFYCRFIDNFDKPELIVLSCVTLRGEDIYVYNTEVKEWRPITDFDYQTNIHILNSILKC